MSVMTPELTAHMKSGRYLPKIIRDFHDQKRLFKRICWGLKDCPLAGNWINAHIFTIDFFLWFMAIRGYELRKVGGSKIPRLDLQEDLNDFHSALGDRFRTTDICAADPGEVPESAASDG